MPPPICPRLGANTALRRCTGTTRCDRRRTRYGSYVGADAGAVAELTRRARRTRVRYHRPARGKRAHASRTTLQRGTPLAHRTLVVAVDTDNPDRPLEPELAEFEALARSSRRADRRARRSTARSRRSGDAGRQRQGARDRRSGRKNSTRISCSCSTICARVSARTSRRSIPCRSSIARC